MSKTLCYHCGDDTEENLVVFHQKNFCCIGCKTVYQIFNDHQLSEYYNLETTPGINPEHLTGKFNFLDSVTVVEKLLDFKEDGVEVVTLYIPNIHCSSCVWVLENLQKLNTDVMNSRVHFSKKTVQITYGANTSLKALVTLLASIGYEPYISLEDGEKKQKTSRTSTYKLAVAGFAFGNTMFLSFPDYFGKPDVWLTTYQPLFAFLMFVFSLPVVFYAGNEYFISAYKGLRKRILNIDVPISMGMAVLFVRSVYEYFTQTGQGYFDSLTGLVFFLLLGRFFQKKTYDFLSFERDFKSYFPIAVTLLKENKEKVVPVNEIQENDVLLIRNEEIIPTDGIVLKGTPILDYSFVTGESNLIHKQSGDKVFAGGKQQGSTITLQVTKTVDQSYLTKLWSQNSYQSTSTLTNITDNVSRYFTWGLLLITIISAVFWFFVDRSQVINVVSSILIVACPCALALSAPFAMGNVLRVLGKKGFYLKDASVIENIAAVKTMFFDKTGTLTSRNNQDYSYHGKEISSTELGVVKSLVRNSNHPLSRILYHKLKANTVSLSNFKEIAGKGLQATYHHQKFKIGSALFVNNMGGDTETESRVYVSVNDVVKGYFKFGNRYRTYILKMLTKLSQTYQLAVLSGDNNSALPFLKSKLSPETKFYFNQSPHDKLKHIKESQQNGQSVLMVGDGLNDAGALLQAQVGIAVAEDVNVFSPASDAIIDAKQLVNLPKFISLCIKSLHVVKLSFVLSILYNIVGLYFAISGGLTPLIAAVLMPLSSITIVTFVTVFINILARKL